MNKYTPKPWLTDFWRAHQKKVINIGPVSTEGGSPICSVVATIPIKGEEYSDEEMANARLISAAPDLYEVLKDILGTVGFTNLNDANWQKAKQALAKAEGKGE